jgi:hypothetical protein
LAQASSPRLEKRDSETRSNRSSVNSKATNTSSDIPLSSSSSVTTSSSFLHINHPGSPHVLRNRNKPNKSGLTDRKHFVSSINISINQSSESESSFNNISKRNEVTRVKNEINLNKNLSKIIALDLDFEDEKHDNGRVQNRSSFIASGSNYESICNSSSGRESSTSVKQQLQTSRDSAFKVYEAKSNASKRNNQYQSAEDVSENINMAGFFVKPPPSYADESLMSRKPNNNPRESYTSNTESSRQSFIELVDQKSSKFKFLPRDEQQTPPSFEPPAPPPPPPPGFDSNPSKQQPGLKRYSFDEFDYLTIPSKSCKAAGNTYENLESASSAYSKSGSDEVYYQDKNQFSKFSPRNNNNFILRSRSDLNSNNVQGVKSKESCSTEYSTRRKGLVEIFPQIDLKQASSNMNDAEDREIANYARKKSSKPIENMKNMKQMSRVPEQHKHSDFIKQMGPNYKVFYY